MQIIVGLWEDRYGCYNYLFGNFIIGFTYFIILGIMQYRSEKPVSINTGEKPLRKDELTNVTEWNHRHGRNFIILGCVLFITQAVLDILLKSWMALWFRWLFI